MEELKEKHAISVVLDLNDTKAEARHAEKAGLKYIGKRIPMVPTFETMVSLSKAMDKEVRNGKKVFVHCHQGIYRGPTIAAAYLIYKGMSTQEAIKQIRDRRPSALPGIKNSQKLVPALNSFEKKIRSESTWDGW